MLPHVPLPHKSAPVRVGVGGVVVDVVVDGRLLPARLGRGLLDDGALCACFSDWIETEKS